jgi:hypothetical protein
VDEPVYRRNCVALHFTWRYDWEGVKQLLPRIGERLAPFDARPHWGKLFTTPAPTLRARYERLPDFRTLVEYFDPKGTFRNTFLETFVFGNEFSIANRWPPAEHPATSARWQLSRGSSRGARLARALASCLPV